MDFQETIFSIISDISGFSIEKLSEDKSMEELELNSIVFIQIVIQCENKFGIEFEDDQLLLNNFPTIKHLIEYVQLKYQEVNKEE